MRRRRRGARVLLFGGLALLGLALLLAAAGAWLLRTPSGRRAVLGRAAAWAEARWGVAVSAADFELRPLAGRLVIDSPAVALPGADPIFRAERIELAWRLRALLGRPRVVDSLEVVAPEVDLDAPRPALAAGENGGGGPPGVELRRWAIRRGSARGGGLRIDGAELTGSLGGGGEVELELRRAGVRFAGEAVETSPVEIGGSLGGRLDGTLRLERLELDGEGLSGAVEGEWSLVAGGPRRVGWTLEARPGDLVRGLAAGGSLASTGTLDLAAAAGSVRLEARELPAELLRRVVDPLPDELAGVRLDADGDFEIGPGSLTAVGGRLRLAASRGAKVLLAATLEPRFAELPGPGRLAVAAELLPGRAGRRHLEAVLVDLAPSEPAAGRLERASLELEAPRLDVALADLQRLSPRLGAPALPLALGGGALSLDGRFAGPLTDPEAEIEARWKAGDAEATLSARGRPLQRTATASADLRVADLAALAPDLSGRLRAAAGASIHGGEPQDGRFEVVVDGLATGGVPLVDSLALRGGLDGRRLRLEALEASRGDLRVAGQAEAWLESPLARAAAHLRLRLPAAPAEELPLALALEGGVLSVETPGLELAGRPGSLEARAPLEALARLPEIGPRLAELPLARADGPVEIRWDLPRADWTPWLPGSAGLESLAAATRGELVLDPGRPLASRGTLEVGGLEARRAGWRLAAAEPLALSLGDRRLVLRPMALRLAEDPCSASSDGAPRTDCAVELLAARGAVELEPEWSPGDPLRAAFGPLELEGSGRLPLDLLASQAAGVAAAGGLDLSFRIGGTPSELLAELRVGSDDARARFDDGPELTRPRIELAVDGRRAELRRLDLEVNGRPLEIEGGLVLDAGRLRAGLHRIDFAGCSGALEVDAPWPPAGADPAAAAVEIVGRVPPCDWEPVLALALPADEPRRLHAGFTGRLLLDPARPAAGSAELRVSGLAAGPQERPLEALDDLVLHLDAGVLKLEPLRLRGAGETFRAAGRLQLDPEWAPGGGLEALVRGVELDASGGVAAELVAPFLGGAGAEGRLALEARLRGGLGDLRGEAVVSGPGAAFTLWAPYYARIEDPELDLEIVEGRIRLRAGGLRLNEGRVFLEGEGRLDGPLHLGVRLREVQLVLDYGLRVEAAGEIQLGWSPPAEPVLSGQLEVVRGSLTRPIPLDRELLAGLLAPIDLTGAESGPLDRVALDLRLTTRDGVRIKNNLADLWVRWDPIRVGGTLGLPLPEGRLEVDPGGRVFALGQTLSLDRASIAYSGREGAPPEVDLVATSAQQDPGLQPLAGDRPFGGREEAAAGPDLGALSTGVAAFYGEQIAASLSDALWGARLSLRPIQIFGETDPGTRLTVSRDFSANVALAASLDLRNPDAQTYVMELHGVDSLPGLEAQLYTKDLSRAERAAADEEARREGATLRQSLRLGGASRAEENAPKIRRLRVEAPAGMSKRRLRRASGLERGESFADGDDFAAEVELVEHLRRRGWADARVDVEASDAAGRRRGVDVAVAVRPGPRASYRFTGDRPPERLRRTITALYRSDFYEEASLEEMRAQTVRAFRSRGFVEPRVTVEVEGDGSGGRIVTVDSSRGARSPIERIEFPGLPADAAEFLALRFATGVQRVELAAGEQGAERRLMAGLDFLGYPSAAIAGRQVAGGVLEVGVEPGPRLRVGRLEVEAGGVAGAGIASRLPLAPGDPARRDRIAEAALALERELRRAGRADARVVVHLEPLAGEPQAVAMRLVADPGPAVEVAELGWDGLRSTRRRWAASVAGLEPGSPLVEDRVFDARRRLFATGLFRRVTPRVERLGIDRAAVRFDLEERHRFEIAYGLRWDSEEGTSGLAEAYDHNFLGRGLELGLRALYASNDRSLRALVEVPRLFGSRASLQLFGLLRRETEDLADLGAVLIEDRFETTLQLSYPIGERWTGRAYGRWRDTELRLEEPDPFFPDQSVQSPIVGLQLVYDSRSDRFLAERGVFATLDLSGTDPALGNDFGYSRFFGQASAYLPVARLGARRLIWAQSLRVGAAEAFGDALLDPDDRFYAGGEYSVRGYRRESLGPVERFGPIVRPRGGDALLIVNQELRLKASDSLTLLAFLDAGNAYLELGDLGSDLLRAIGLGIRATTPIGLVRLDLAHALDRRPRDPEFKLYLGLGSTF